MVWVRGFCARSSKASASNAEPASTSHTVVEIRLHNNVDRRRGELGLISQRTALLAAAQWPMAEGVVGAVLRTRGVEQWVLGLVAPNLHQRLRHRVRD